MNFDAEKQPCLNSMKVHFVSFKAKNYIGGAFTPKFIYEKT